MIGRMGLAALLALAWGYAARAQDVPGIEICTVEKTMERRTSCLQSNVEFLHKTIDKMRLEQQQKLELARAQISALTAALASVQKQLGELQTAQTKAKPEPAGQQTAPAKEPASSPAQSAPTKAGAK